MRAVLTLGLVTAVAIGTARAQAPSGAQPAAPILKVGDMAPDFSLQGTDGKTHRLSDYRGKQSVVLAWFPKAFTQGCTIECKSENGDKIKYGVLNARGLANRWTFYIDKAGKISAIDTAVKPPTSAEDMLARLAELKVPMRKGS